jgi:hypothetical protein
MVLMKRVLLLCYEHVKQEAFLQVNGDGGAPRTEHLSSSWEEEEGRPMIFKIIACTCTHPHTSWSYINYRQSSKMLRDKKQSLLSSSSSPCAPPSSSVLHTPDILLVIFCLIPPSPSTGHHEAIYSTLPYVCKDWYLVSRQDDFWRAVIKAEAPFLLFALQQEENQENQDPHQHVPFRSAEDVVRQWLKSCRRYSHSELFEKEEEELHKKRLQGCSLVIAFFCRAEDKEPFAQIIMPCDDEEKLSQAFDARRHVMLELNEKYNGDPDFFDRNHPWVDIDDEVEAKLAPTRILMYIVDAQRGRFVHLLHVSGGDYNGNNNYSDIPRGFQVCYTGDIVSPSVDAMDLYGLGMSIYFFWPAEERGDEARPAGIYAYAEIFVNHGDFEPTVDQVRALLYAQVESPAYV